jgi:molybdenum cofactor synthesis domain-containing protein
MKTAVITVSDSAAAGLRQDASGPAVRGLLEQHGFTIVASTIIPDHQTEIENTIIEMCEKAELVLTTGGTGLAASDVTPEATRSVIEREVPGIAERMRHEGALRTPMAALSRGICGTRAGSLIINLPGSPAGAVDSLSSVIELLPHALDLLSGKTEHTPNS